MRDDLARELARLIRTAQADRLPGVSAALARDGEVVWQDAVGIADASAGEEVTPDHQYRIGSITKTFTAVAIMQLRDAGALGLDDPLSAHVPEAAEGQPTIRRLLSHLAGIQREPPGAVWETLDFPTGAELIERLPDAEQVLPPGRRWHYSNLAFALLGEVVERRGGRPYERYVEERIIEPLGLARTGFMPTAPVATPYVVDPYTDVVHLEPTLAEGGSGGAAGSLWSTVLDLCRWGAFLSNPDPVVLAPATLAEMTEVQAMIDPDEWTVAWGLGLELVREGELILVGHTGGMPGFLASVFASRKQAIVASVLLNSSNRGEPLKLATQMIAKAVELEPPPPSRWAPAEPPLPGLADVLGRWWTEGAEFVLSWRSGRLEARMADDPSNKAPAVFERVAPDRYRATAGREQGELLEVVRDADGVPVKLYWATYPCTRAFRGFGAAAT